jgi:lysylphosphatidylglycerol synthetase-like protein (DUF2156 family)
MRSILSFIKRLVGAMVKGFFYTGVVAAILCAVVLFVLAPGHRVTLDTSAVFAVVIALLAGVLGAAVALIYHLSHLDSLHHAVHHLSAQRTDRSDSQSPTR